MHEHTHSHDHGATPQEELTALLHYMVHHNEAHAKELAGLARQLAKELIQDRPGSMWTSAHEALVPVEGAALDGFWWLQKDDGTQYAVARLGRQVLLVEYEGQTDLRTAGDYLAGLLER